MSGNREQEIGHNSLRVELVTRLDQFVNVLAIRALCYMNDEEPLPADQALDGNDLQASHFVAYLDNEPIGALRIRWFRDFAKIERTGFRKEYRSRNILKRTARPVFEHIARKGYTRVLTHGTPKYARMWCMVLGFQPVEKPAAYYFDHPYVEIEKILTAPSNAITANSSVGLLFRTEGTWDRPGKYEQIHAE